LIDKIVSIWQADKAPLYPYQAGSMGPDESFDLLKQYDTSWVGNQTSGIASVAC
jgi:glucose-6-phosphate 1-dehydrogenase